MEHRASILIADDDPSCQSTTFAFLSNCGYHCDCASTGDEALALLKQNRYDLLLSDIEMPGNRDLQLIQVVPQVQTGLPVILMTGYPTIQTAASSVGLSVAAYLIKPVDPEALLAQVAQAIERSRCFRTIAGTRERMISTCEDLKKIETLLSGSSYDDKNASLLAFLDLTMQNVAGSLLDLRHMVETMTSAPRQGAQELDWMQSSRPLVLVVALREAITVLAKTKSSFKSKELADLRRKLESLLQWQPEVEECPN
jgi:CheY-like chemotaxis protein